MGRPKRAYPLGRFRLRVPKVVDKDKKYPVELEYTWNRKILRKNTNVSVRKCDWNPSGHSGRGAIRASYGEEYKRLNNLLLQQLEKMDANLAEYNQIHPDQITCDVINGFLNGKPLSRNDGGKDFVDFVMQHLQSEYARNRIKYSRLKNGESGMNIFKEFLVSTDSGTIQGNLFDTVNREKQAALAKAIDEINRKNGHNTIRVAVQGFEKKWHLKNEYISKQYTTNLDDVIVVKAK